MAYLIKTKRAKYVAFTYERNRQEIRRYWLSANPLDAARFPTLQSAVEGGPVARFPWLEDVA